MLERTLTWRILALALALPTTVLGEGATDARKRGEDRPKIAGPIQLDLAAGARDGRHAIGFWPSTHWVQTVPGDPTGIEAHLVPRDDLDRELVRPAGEWHWDLEPAWYVYWLEGPGKISTSPGLFHHTGTGQEGFPIITRLTWAGTVKVEPPAPLPERAQVRMQGLDPYLAGENIGFLFWRRADPKVARAGLQMPAGRVLVGLWDAAASRYVAHARPLIADPAKAVVAKLEPPAPGTSDLVVVLRRPRPAMRALDDDVTLAVRTKEGKELAPEAYGRANDRLVAIWYGLAPGTVELRVSSAKAQLPATYIELRADHIERHEASLLEAPKLTISLDLPAAMDGVERVVSVALAPTMEPITGETLAGSERELVLQVPPAILDVTAEVGVWKLTQRVDLSDGADAEMVLRADGVLVAGRVLRGEHLERNATLTFGYEEDSKLATQSLDDGSYSLLLPRAGWWPVGVRLSGRSTSAVVLLEVDENDPEGADVVVPDNEWTVTVVDATNGEPVTGATVAVGNVAAADGFRTWMRGETDKAGEALLHPLRPGKAELSARAAGYRERPPQEEEVPEGSDRRGFVLELEPETAAVALSVVLADGSPAMGAAAACVGPDGALTAERIADPSGQLHLEPSAPGIECLLLVRHPHAAPWAGTWHGQPLTMHLPPPGAPLNLRVSGSSGPVAWAGLFVWIEGHRLAGRALGFFAKQSTDRDGLWTLPTTPPGELRILAVTPPLGQLAQTGALDSQGQLVSPAGQSIVEITAVR